MDLPFKTPSRFMAGLITLMVMGLFALLLTAPLWNPKATFDEALKQELLAIVMICVGFYLGSSKDSGDKNDVIATQASTAAAIAAVPTPPVPPVTPPPTSDGIPVVKVVNADPIPVTEASAPVKPGDFR